jgi:hypothetical protein
MPIPGLPDSHQRNRPRAKPFQLNINRAAIAPTWNKAIKNVVVQFIGCLKVLSDAKTLMVWSLSLLISLPDQLPISDRTILKALTL